LAPSGAGLLILKLFWRQKARVVLRLKISGMILRNSVYYICKSVITFVLVKDRIVLVENILGYAQKLKPVCCR
jgi:hypothetical protein